MAWSNKAISLMCFSILSHGLAVADESPADIRIATWNVEHLAYPIDSGCRPRTQEELQGLKDYAQSLDADVIALQEVASAAAVEQLFPSKHWQIVMSSREDSPSYECRGSGRVSTQQKVAFAVRKGIVIDKTDAVAAFGLDVVGLRYGLEMDLQTHLGPLKLLNLHLKSGCFVDNFTRSDTEACTVFARQAPILDEWVDQQEQSNTPYIILGDFNHRLTAPYNRLTMMLTQNADGQQNSLVNTNADMIGCHPYYPAPIDNILLGNGNSQSWTYTTQVQPFADMEVDSMLSDHCAVVAEFSVVNYPLSNAVQWQTISKEYKALTRTVYHKADERIRTHTPQGNWVVVMDVDETVLDNSPYQVALDKSGKSYTPASWDSWVKSEKAELVPGAKTFIESVYGLGGRVALITNRDKTLDAHTWNNISRLVEGVNTANTCLIGRSLADKEAINSVTLINDKDLRRMQVKQGKADCFAPNNSKVDWPSDMRIAMQVGDNIEDFAGTTQEDADIDLLLPELNQTLFLLPNSMYGSW